MLPGTIPLLQAGPWLGFAPSLHFGVSLSQSWLFALLPSEGEVLEGTDRAISMEKDLGKVSDQAGRIWLCLLL